MNQPFFKITNDGNGKTLRLHGEWVLPYSDAIRRTFKDLPASVRMIDASGIDRIDLWGLLKLQSLGNDLQAEIILNDDQRRMANFLPMDEVKLASTETTSPFSAPFETLGRGFYSTLQTTYGMMGFIGEIATVFVKCIVRPRGFRFHSIIRHIEETGIRALPIISLLAILISMVISYQAATQLQRFGASIFTVDLTVISILREMGVLTTAIMVAGRSGSAFAAEIGVMKLREEVDALRTMGLNPIEMLVLPRVIAMMITLPILTFIADIMGLAGGGIVSALLLNIPLDQYIDRVDMVAKPTMFFVGLIKAPVFAFVIAIVGTYQGMNVSGSAESVGKLTTVAVVQSIFLVIMLDALFSIVFSQLGI